MCIHEFYRSTACGHHFPKLQPSAKPNVFFNDYHPTIAVPQSLKCAPVKLALKFYHDQVVYSPADMTHGAKVEMPKACPIVHQPRHGVTKRAMKGQQIADLMLRDRMRANGLGPRQERQVKLDAAILDQCSNRAKEGEHSVADLRRHKRLPYPVNMYAHVQSVKDFQTRDVSLIIPNVKYINVDFGCGGPFSAECLIGWTEIGLLTHRLHLWGDPVTHPRRCNADCLVGWSGDDLDKYRQKTWARYDPKIWKNVDLREEYPNIINSHMTLHNERSVLIDYSSLSHQHEDQFDWNGTKFIRLFIRLRMKKVEEVWVPELVSVPVPERLHQVLLRRLEKVLQGMRQVPLPDPPSIEDILGRLTEAFDQEQPPTGRCLQPPLDFADGSANHQELSTGEGSQRPVDSACGSTDQGEPPIGEGAQLLVDGANGCTNQREPLTVEGAQRPIDNESDSSNHQELLTRGTSNLPVDIADGSANEEVMREDSQPLAQVAEDTKNHQEPSTGEDSRPLLDSGHGSVNEGVVTETSQPLTHTAEGSTNLQEPPTEEGIQSPVGSATGSTNEEESSTEESLQPLIITGDGSPNGEVVTETLGPQAQVAQAESSDSDTTAVDEEGSVPERRLTLVETPEEAEARRQKAKKTMKEKIDRDFPNGGRAVVVDEDTDPADS